MTQNKGKQKKGERREERGTSELRDVHELIDGERARAVRVDLLEAAVQALELRLRNCTRRRDENMAECGKALTRKRNPKRFSNFLE